MGTATVASAPPDSASCDDSASTAKTLAALDAASRRVSLEPSLLELVQACAFQMLPVWRETPVFTARERAALELTEAGTRPSEGPASGDVFAEAIAQFSDVELAELIRTITEANAWNQVGAPVRPRPAA